MLAVDQKANGLKPGQPHEFAGGGLRVESRFTQLVFPYACIYKYCAYKYCNAAWPVKMPKRKPSLDYPPCLYLRMRIATRRLLGLYESHLADARISMPQFGLLIAAAEEPDLAMSRLAEKRAISPSTLTRTLRPLEAEGLVEVYADPNSKRVRRVRLTQPGRARMRVAYAAWKKAQTQAAAIMPPALVERVLNATEALTR